VSGGNDGVSKLKLSNPSGSDAKGNLAFEPYAVEDQIARSMQLAEYEKRIQHLEQNIAKLKKHLAEGEKKEPQPKSGSQGTARHIAHAEGWQAVCTAPDFCKVGKDVIAFNSFATLDQKRSASPNVKARGTAIYRQGDVLQNVQADAGKHVVSGTSLGSGHVKILDGHANVKVNGVPVARHDSRCLINCDASGFGGAQGKLVTEQKAAGSDPPRVESTVPPGQRTSAKLEALKKAREEVAAGMLNFDALDEYVNFEQTNEVLDGLIKNISADPGTGADYAAQVARGVLGFAKDFVLGAGELAYEGIKAVPKFERLTQTESGRLHAQLDAQILAENIRLDNISAGSMGQSALNIGKAIVAPVRDPWEKGQYVESGTRAITEIFAASVGWLKASKVARAAKAADAAKAASSAKSVAASTTTVSPPILPGAGGASAGRAVPGVHIKSKTASTRKLTPFAVADRRKITKLSNEAGTAQNSARAARSIGDEDAALGFDNVARTKLLEARRVLRPFVNTGDVDAMIDRLDVSSPKDGAYFWSGFADGAKDRAGAVAHKLGGVTLESTAGGRVVDGWASILDDGGRDFEKAFWQGVSKKYASGVEGKVGVVQSDSAWLKGGGDIWKLDELPALLAKGKATELEYLDLNLNIREVVPLKVLVH
jgi:uncharacterized Zn-binding protein involved in type VI secretion